MAARCHGRSRDVYCRARHHHRLPGMAPRRRSVPFTAQTCVSGQDTAGPWCPACLHRMPHPLCHDGWIEDLYRSPDRLPAGRPQAMGHQLLAAELCRGLPHRTEHLRLRTHATGFQEPFRTNGTPRPYDGRNELRPVPLPLSFDVLLQGRPGCRPGPPRHVLRSGHLYCSIRCRDMVVPEMRTLEICVVQSPENLIEKESGTVNAWPRRCHRRGRSNRHAAGHGAHERRAGI